MNSDSSLDRFLRNRAASGLGLADRRLYSLQGLMGGILTGSAIVTMATQLMDNTVEMAKSSIVVLFAGVFLLTSSITMRRRHQNTQADLKLSPEAKGLLLRLVRRRLGWFQGGGFTPIGSNMPMGPTRHQIRRIAYGTGEDLGFGWRWSNKADVSPIVMELLDVAAEQYNRIQGILQTPASTSSTLGKLSSPALAAADEAMADILHDCAALDKYPESASAARKQVENAVHSLRELGDRLEDLATRDTLITDKVDYSSRIDSVLEELRLEQLARHELQGNNGENEQRLRE